MDIKDIISSGLLELYATGTATDAEILQVEQWAVQYPEVAAELKEIEESMEQYARTCSMAPDTSVKEKIFSRIYKEPAKEISFQPVSQTITSHPSYWKWMAAASVLLLAGSLAMNFSQYHKNNAVSAEVKEMHQRLATIEDQNKAFEEDMNVMHNKNALAVSLKGLAPAPEAEAKIFWMKNTGEVYIDPSNLPAAPEGKQYQLWAMVDGKPVDAGMISASVGKQNSRMQKMKTFAKAEAFAVTLESQAGNILPQGPMYVMGKV